MVIEGVLRPGSDVPYMCPVFPLNYAMVVRNNYLCNNTKCHSEIDSVISVSGDWG